MNVLNCLYYVNSTVYFIEGIFKLGTVWDTLGHFGTKYCVIIVLSKKAKAQAAHPPALFLCPNSERKWFPCDSFASKHRIYWYTAIDATSSAIATRNSPKIG